MTNLKFSRKSVAEGGITMYHAFVNGMSFDIERTNIGISYHGKRYPYKVSINYIHAGFFTCLADAKRYCNNFHKNIFGAEE